MAHGVDLANMPTADLDVLLDDVRAEVSRRVTIDNAPAQVREINQNVLNASGRQPGKKWTQPTGAHDAYPAGWTVVHGGKTWESLIDNNVHEPGVSGWREEVPPGQVPEWVQPSGAHDAYKVGDRVRFQGSVYESVIDANTWSPADYPAGWRQVE